MIDLNKAKQIYKIGKDLSFEDIEVIIKTAKVKSFKKKSILIEEESLRKEVFYVIKGIVRCYHVNDKGEEVTFRLIPENYIVANMDMIFSETPSRFYYSTLEDTQTYSMDFNLLEKIIEENAKLAANRKFIVRKMLLYAHQRLESFILHSPEERYLRYVKEYPNMINRVPDKYIANILGITPVSLSRIRKRIASKK